MSESSTSMFGNDSDAYERYMGRWSRLVAPEFLRDLDEPASSRWLEVGCGTGNLTRSILESCDPATVHGIDTSPGFIVRAREAVPDQRASFGVFDTETLPVDSDAFDVVVSGLVLNFIPDVELAIREMVRAAKPGGVVAAYVWDYGGKMEIMRKFWDVAVAIDPSAAKFDEGNREPALCNPEALTAHFEAAGLIDVTVHSIDAHAHFENFDDYWPPFTGNQGSAPRYVASLNADARESLEQKLRANLAFANDGSLDLIARTWAVSGRRPPD
jgi:ubiquinone/menaquinone biosynthesis C-methylase UbiE